MAVSGGVSDAYGHDSSADVFAVYLQVHAVELAFEDEGDECHEAGEGLESPEAAGLVGDSDDACSEADVDGVEEVSGDVFPSVVVAALSDVYFSESSSDEAVDGVFVFGGESPVSGEVVSDAVGYDAEGDLAFVFGV